EKIDLSGVDQRGLFGQKGVYLNLIESQFEAKIIARGDWITIEGEPGEVGRLQTLFSDLISYLSKNGELNERYILYSIAIIKENGRGPTELMDTESAVTSVATKGAIRPKTIGQDRYVKAIEANDIVFSIGPAGTGKTYLAVAKAVSFFKRRLVQRIVLTRPAVEAGESLGFLPGDIRAKVDPYLRPLYDALQDMLAAEKIKKLMELGTIEIAPLAFMRGRNLSNSFVILDEGQNTTTGQMKMFLTRLGLGSKAVITGDITQIDLDDKKGSGLVRAQKILAGIKGIEFVYLTEKDIVRHRLVQDIVKAYERHEGRLSKGRKGGVKKRS
ncbi:MAG: PhoH family protein, partial [Candidatus Zixiibacteriota bacterium]